MGSAATTVISMIYKQFIYNIFIYLSIYMLYISSSVYDCVSEAIRNWSGQFYLARTLIAIFAPITEQGKRLYIEVYIDRYIYTMCRCLGNDCIAC